MLIFKKSKNLLHKLKDHINQIKTTFERSKRIEHFCDRNLHKHSKTLIIIFVNFNSTFFPKYFPLKYSIRLWLSNDYQINQFYFNCSKVIIAWKLVQWIKNHILATVHIIWHTNNQMHQSYMNIKYDHKYSCLKSTF